MIPFPLLVVLQLAIGVVGPLPTPTAPPGLEVELRTVANRTTFRLSELVPLEVAFRATGDVMFSIEIVAGEPRRQIGSSSSRARASSTGMCGGCKELPAATAGVAF
jgi:hypothetical protein